MDKKKLLKYSVIILIGLAVLGVGGFFSYNYYLKLKKEVTSAYHAIPANSNAVIEINEPAAFWNTLNRQEITRQFRDIPEINSWFNMIGRVDSILASNENFLNWLKNNKLLFSLHYRGSDKFSVVALLQLSNTRQQKPVMEFMEEHAAVGEVSDNPYKVYKAAVSDSLSFFFSIPDGILLVSFDRGLLEQSLHFMNEGRHVMTDPQFRTVYDYRGKNVSANVFFNHDGFHRFMAGFAASGVKEDFSKWSEYGRWTETDLILENDGLWFSGHTTTSDSAAHFLNVFDGQVADRTKIAGVLPARTALLSYYGLDNFSDFYKKYQRYLPNKDQRDRYFSNFLKNYDRDLPTYFLSWIDDEFARNIVRTSAGEFFEYAVIATRDRKEAVQSLGKLSKAVNGNAKSDLDTLTYRQFQIDRIKDPYLFNMLFGERFSGLKNPYYTVIGDYAVFAVSVEAIKYAINAYILNNTLDESKAYKEFADKIAGSANIYLYYNLQYALDFILSSLSESSRQFADQNLKHLMDIPYGGFQYQYQNGRIYTNFYIKSDTLKVEEVSSGWQVALEAPLATAPQFVVDHYTHRKKVVAFDVRKNMYLIDLKGEIQWRLKLKELPLGDVELIDYYDNDKYQYLFSSPSYIYCVALDGNHLDGFPFETESENSSPVAAFDYRGNKDYRLLVAGNDNVIYNYLKSGKEVRGWEKPTTSHLVKNKLKRIVLDNKDFIIVADTSGSVYFLNRRGEQRITPEPAFTNNTRTSFYEVKQDNDELMMTTDKGGRIIFIDKQGEVDKVSLNEFSPAHSFAWQDIDGDGSNDYVFMDQGYLYAYDQTYKIILKQELPEAVWPDMVFIETRNDSPVVLLRKRINDEVFKLSAEGIEQYKEPVYSSFRPLVYDNPSEKTKNLIISSGKIIESMPFN